MNTKCTFVAAGLVMATAFSAPRAQESAPSLATVQNLGYAASRVAVEAGVVAFTVSEPAQGGVDLNGDGDATDLVLHVYDDATGATTNLGLQVGLLWAVGGHRVAVFVLEEGLGDLNRDGDTADEVIHVLDLATATVANTGLASHQTPLPIIPTVLAGEGFVAIFVPETDQGGADLNGDGDLEDFVLHVYDTEQGVTTNVGLAGDIPGLAAISARWVAVSVSEDSQGSTDLNGDGDTGDLVLHLLDPATGAYTNLGMTTSGVVVFPQHVAYLVDEETQGATDLSGDGDAVDDVLFVRDLATGVTTNLGLTSWTTGIDRLGDELLVMVREWDLGSTDLNGDGDANDIVAHVHDLIAGTTNNLMLAGDDLDDWFAPVDDRRALLSVSESSSGGVDRNGDGDVLDDVIHVYDGGTGAVTNMELAGWAWRRGHRLAMAVNEPMQGGVDLSGDGDAGDSVLFVRDLATGATVNLRLPVFPLDPACDALFAVSENSAGQDLNGDGDLIDQVLHAFDLYTGTTQNLSLAGLLTAFDEALQVVTVGEAGQGHTDLNGDGDTEDSVLHLVRPGYAYGLSSDADKLSIAAGGTQTLSLDTGSAHEGDVYVVLGSLAGTVPGFAHFTFTVPLNPDPYFWLTLSSPNPPLSGGFGRLDGWGEGEAVFSLPPASFPPLVGQIAHHAFVAIDTAIPAVSLVSDPVPLAFLP